MDKIIKKFISEHFEDYFDACVVPCIRNNREKLFPELEKNLCVEHYNNIHKTNLTTQNEIELNPTECWVCKAKKGRC